MSLQLARRGKKILSIHRALVIARNAQFARETGDNSFYSSHLKPKMLRLLFDTAAENYGIARWRVIEFINFCKTNASRMTHKNIIVNTWKIQNT